jgi:hypothetical protein
MFGRIKSLLPFHLGATSSSAGDQNVGAPLICNQNGSTANLADVITATRSDCADFDNNLIENHNDCNAYSHPDSLSSQQNHVGGLCRLSSRSHISINRRCKIEIVCVLTPRPFYTIQNCPFCQGWRTTRLLLL